MGKSFEVEDVAEVPATPEQVWDAIATGPGIDSWFMGANDVRDGVVTMAFGEYQPTSRVTAWEPPNRFAHDSGEEPDGRFMAYEFLVRGTRSGSAVVRVVTSGFLPGEDWADEFEAMSHGGSLFFRTLATYLTHFGGRFATPVTVFGPVVTDWARAWSTLYRALGLGDTASVGDRVRLSADGIGDVDGVVYHVNAQTLGIRTDNAMYRFLQGFHGPMIAGHHLFDGTDPAVAEQAWQTWLTRTLP